MLVSYPGLFYPFGTVQVLKNYILVKFSQEITKNCYLFMSYLNY